MKRLGLLVIMVLSIFGIADASYLTWQKMRGSIAPCQAAFQCDIVLSSSWSSIGPVPVSALGVVFYLIIVLLAVVLYLSVTEVRLGKIRISLWAVLLMAGIVGVLVSLLMITIMGLILKAWCLYCLMSALNCGVLFLVISLMYYIRKDSQYES